MARSGRTVAVPIALGVLALALVGVALWAAIAAGAAADEADGLRTEADRLSGRAGEVTRGVDLANRALTDTDRTVALTEALRPIVERTLSYDYRDLDSTAKAVRENLAGKALCQHENLFGQVQRLAPEQRIVLTTKVNSIGVRRLDGDTAEVLLFVDQRTTRADQNQSTASGAQFNVKAEQRDGKWKITEFDLLGQPLPGGTATPAC
jgi:Mce-associated membrane protein